MEVVYINTKNNQVYVNGRSMILRACLDFTNAVYNAFTNDFELRMSPQQRVVVSTGIVIKDLDKFDYTITGDSLMLFRNGILCQFIGSEYKNGSCYGTNLMFVCVNIGKEETVLSNNDILGEVKIHGDNVSFVKDGYIIEKKKDLPTVNERKDVYGDNILDI